AKLLRAVQEREIDRVGGSKPVPLDVRIIATSNRDMESEVANGNFREDLYFRLNVVNLKIPPLSGRPQDIPVLTEHFIKKYAEANGLEVLPLSAEAEKVLAGHAWPGNVRELENAMERAVVLEMTETLLPESLPEEIVEGPDREKRIIPALDDQPLDLEKTLDNIERNIIKDAYLSFWADMTWAVMADWAMMELLVRQIPYSVTDSSGR
ncbi:MAG: sigma-54-dependent Fis family transcriptional regulator, partial [Planctomycetes bacterium]|nr:sigma-54-dependent Fis family transcriptional regulator [Planctomycetota bacterium]